MPESARRRGRSTSVTVCVDLVGHGLSRSFIGAILAFGIERHEPSTLRVLILRWNERSRRAAERQGFELAGTHGDFDLMTRNV